jgi:hypothetical protein
MKYTEVHKRCKNFLLFFTQGALSFRFLATIATIRTLFSPKAKAMGWQLAANS